MITKHHHDTETRIFARMPSDRAAIVEVTRLPGGGNFHTLHETLRELPPKCEIDIQFRAVEPDRIVRRHGGRRLRCDAGRVRQDFAALQAAACEAGVMFV